MKKRIIKYCLGIIGVSVILGILNCFITIIPFVVIGIIALAILIGIELEKLINKLNPKYEQDKPPKSYFYLSLFLPIIGFIMWCVFVNHKPNTANSCGKGALSAFLLSIILGIIGVISFFLISFSTNIIQNTFLMKEITIHSTLVPMYYNEEATVIKLSQDKFDLKIRGLEEDLETFAGRYLLSDNFQNEYERNRYIDISKLDQSIKSFNLEQTIFDFYEGAFNQDDELLQRLDYEIIGADITLTIHDKISRAILVDYDLINEEYLADKVSVVSVELDRNQVVVKGDSDSLDAIASVKALIDLENRNFTTPGIYNVDNIELVAYDSNDNKLDNIEIVPETITATIIIDEYNDNGNVYDDLNDNYSKTVPLNVQTTGELVTGKAIADILINDSESYYVTISGKERLVKDINNVPITINVDGEGNYSTKIYNVTISRPVGVSTISENTATIKLTFGDEVQKELKLSTISTMNLAAGYTANIISDNIDVTVRGVQSVVDNVNESNINAYVDLTGYTVGEYDVPVQIKNDDLRLNYTIISSSVRVNITN